MWPTPDLPRRPFDLETAEERKLKVEVVTKHLEQPWSVAFLPDESILVTERIGRLRIVREGKFEPCPWQGFLRYRPGDHAVSRD